MLVAPFQNSPRHELTLNIPGYTHSGTPQVLPRGGGDNILASGSTDAGLLSFDHQDTRTSLHYNEGERHAYLRAERDVDAGRGGHTRGRAVASLLAPDRHRPGAYRGAAHEVRAGARRGPGALPR